MGGTPTLGPQVICKKHSWLERKHFKHAMTTSKEEFYLHLQRIGCWDEFGLRGSSSGLHLYHRRWGHSSRPIVVNKRAQYSFQDDSLQDDSWQDKAHRYNLWDESLQESKEQLQKHKMQFVILDDIWKKYSLQEYEVQFVKLHEEKERV